MIRTKKEYQEALNYLKANCEQWVVNEDYRKNGKILDTTFEESDKSSELLQELVEKNERLVAHVKLAIKMLGQNSPYAIETLKEVIEQDWRGENYE